MQVPSQAGTAHGDVDWRCCPCITLWGAAAQAVSVEEGRGHDILVGGNIVSVVGRYPLFVPQASLGAVATEEHPIALQGREVRSGERQCILECILDHIVSQPRVEA